MKPVWSLLPILSAPMPFQMALDEILFRQMEKNPTEPFLRFYYSYESWITVGYSFRGETTSSNGKKICKRITGGGEVQHGEDVLFSLIAHKSHDESFSSVRMSYLKIHEAVKTAFESLGYRPRFYRCDEKLEKGGDCFRFPIATDLSIGDKKVAGGAQKRSAGTLLHQESIQPPKARFLFHPLLFLKRSKELEAEELIKALKHAFEKTFNIQLAEKDLDPLWLRQAEELAAEKYERT